MRITKCVSIKSEHQAHIEKHHLNLSGIIQEKIDELIEVAKHDKVLISDCNVTYGDGD